MSGPGKLAGINLTLSPIANPQFFSYPFPAKLLIRTTKEEITMTKNRVTEIFEAKANHPGTNGLDH